MHTGHITIRALLIWFDIWDDCIPVSKCFEVLGLSGARLTEIRSPHILFAGHFAGYTWRGWKGLQLPKRGRSGIGGDVGILLLPRRRGALSCNREGANQRLRGRAARLRALLDESDSDARSVEDYSMLWR
jgi:hypothetical protein